MGVLFLRLLLFGFFKEKPQGRPSFGGGVLQTRGAPKLRQALTGEEDVAVLQYARSLLSAVKLPPEEQERHRLYVRSMLQV